MAAESSTKQLMRRLGHALRAADFTVDGVSARLGESAVAALARNTTVPARRALGSADDPQATLINLWMLQRSVSVAALQRSLASSAPPGWAAPTLDDLGDLIERDHDQVRARLDLRPYSVESLLDGWVFSDPIPTLDGQNRPTRSDFVLGLSPASTTLAQLAVPGQVGSALDLGTGCGVQSLHLAKRAGRVIATDLNPRALQLAELTAAINGVELDLRLGSLYDPVAEDSFDLIVTNPPYVISPPTGERLIYREDSFRGDELMRRVVTEGAGHLNPHGILQVLGNWAITDAEPWDERLAGWVRPTGCDALILERERLDPAEYVEIWLADAGLVGSPDYVQRYDAWLDYFDQLGITGVGLGWIALYNEGRTTPDLRVERWPHLVHQPVGPAFAAHPEAVTAARTTAADLWAGRWELADHVAVETLGVPGAEDPQHIVLRSTSGFGRAHEVDTALAGVLGACDGELSLGELSDAVADLLAVEAAPLRADLEPKLRQFIADGLLLAPPRGG